MQQAAGSKPEVARGPLKGVRIVEMAGLGPGPFACMLLADLGADVIRVERPQAAEIEGSGRGRKQVFHRSRPSLGLDLKQESGRQQAMSLIRQADALVEGFRPGVMERLGLGPEPCLQANPRLVYGRMTGWGQDGPLAQSPGHDINYIALTGALHAIGPRDGKPVVPLNLVGDFGGGALYLALGLVSGLFEARNSGRGQVVDAAIVDGALSLMGMIYGRMAEGLWQDQRASNLLDGGAPWYDSYETADGKYIALGAIEPQFYQELCRLAGIDAPDASARHDRSSWPAQAKHLAEVFRQRTRDAWCVLLEGSEACFAPVLNMQEAARHPHNLARQNLLEIDGVVQPAPAPRFSRTPGAIQSAPGAPVESGVQRAARWLQR